MKYLQLAMAICLGVASASAGPIGYVFDRDHSLGYKVDLANGTGSSFSTFFSGYTPAIVNGTIRLGDRFDATGLEYTLNGVATGVSFIGGHNFSPLVDGTTNGVNNFGVECCGATNSVMTADLFWQFGTVLLTSRSRSSPEYLLPLAEHSVAARSSSGRRRSCPARLGLSHRFRRRDLLRKREHKFHPLGRPSR